MRERTPSADDTLVRAPPTLSTPPTPPIPPTPASTETASAKVIVDPKVLVGITVAPVASVNSNNNKKMVASSHSLEELGVTHPASASGDRGAPETNRTAQTALDKRSRLSNVINNLRKKVPEAQPQPQPQPQQQQQQQQQQKQKNDNDGRNSVERNLENLEKYVMTVLNGVINDEVEKVEGNQAEDTCKNNRILSFAKEESSTLTSTDIEASFPGNQGSKIEGEEWRSVVVVDSGSEGAKGADKNADEALEGARNIVEDVTRLSETVEFSNGPEERLTDSGKTDLNDGWLEKNTPTDQARDIVLQKTPPRDTQATESDSASIKSQAKLMDVCRELMSDLLNDINHLIEERSRDPEASENSETKFSGSSATSLHCSLPLDKVAPILRSCSTTENQTPVSSSSPQRSPSRPSPPTVRHLCLYCDRKFLSISLRQRHAERVHQVGGGSRRSERNSRRTVQNCQYCSEKVNTDISEGYESSETNSEALDNLDSLFRHMAKSHPDRYYACVQCSTRYATRENLANHLTDVHGSVIQDNIVKELPKERNSPILIREQAEIKAEDETPKKEAFTNPASPEFDSSFYSSVSCNIRENLLHHLDGKLQPNTERAVLPITENKPPPPTQQQQQQQQQNFYETNVTQIQLPIDISLTAATPVYTNSKEYSNDGNENSSEYAQKPGKTRTHPRRVSFEKYNFPRKYDGKEPWSCSIKDLSKFDISTQLTLRKKQQLTKALINNTITLNRLCGSQGGSNEQTTTGSTMRQSGLTEINDGTSTAEDNEVGNVHDALGTANVPSEDSSSNLPRCSDPNINERNSKTTIFTTEFASFMKLKSWEDDVVTDRNNQHQVVYAELTGEWSRPRIYVCGACADRHETLKEMEEHKACAHPNVWCSHFEFAGDQRDLYKHLFLPGKGSPTAKARAAISPEKICTKCSRNCNTLAELHRHMLECGGDQTWLLGLFGNGKKKCKWRPFGSRSRRRRQRGMKRNIQNSQTPRANTPKERPTNGPRVRPSDRESIQKMLANLPPKRASRKVLREENLARSREAAQTVQTRSRPRMSTNVSSSAVQSRNKTVLKNKLLKNAKSFQRNRTRIDNITAAIESVVSRRIEQSTNETKTESKINNEPILTRTNKMAGKNVMRVLSKKKNVKTKDSTINNIEHPRTRGRPFGGIRVSNRSKVKGTSLSVNLPKRNSSKSSVIGRPGNTVNSKNNNRNEQQQGGEKNPKESVNQEENGEKSPRSNTVKTKKKKPVDPVASLNASIKAKQQLRTNDGKFARNPKKKEEEEQQSLKTIVDRYPRRHANAAEFVPKSRIKATKDFTKNQITTKSGKRIGRTSVSDTEKMPTLEPAVSVKNAEAVADGDTDKIGRGNELPVLSPVAISAGRKTPKNNTAMKEPENDVTEKNLSGNQEHLDLDEVLEKSVIDVAEIKNRFKGEIANQRKAGADQKRNRGTRAKRITSVIASPIAAASSASSPTSSVSSTSSSATSLRSKSQRILPRRKNVEENNGVAQSTVKEKPIEQPADKDDLMTRLGPLKVSDQKPRRSTRTSLSKDRGDEEVHHTSQEEISTGRKSREKISDVDENPESPKIGRVRKSPRNLAPKSVSKGLPHASKSKDLSTIEKLTFEDSKDTSDPENPSVQIHLDPEDSLEEEPEEDPEEAHSGLPKRGRGLGKRRGRIKTLEENSSDSIKTKDEETPEPVTNLSLESLQHESSNSNVDSGKENSSETPVTLPKPRAIRPRRTKSGRPSRDRTAKRTLGSVIGILTEGVNIPVEIQQSVVLTVQTTSVTSETAANSESELGPEDEQENEELIEEKTISEKENEDGENPDTIQRLETQCNPNANATKPKSNSDELEVSDSVMHADESDCKNQGVQAAVPLNTSIAQEPPVSEGTQNSDPVPAAGNSNSNEKPTCIKPQVVVEPSNDIIMDLSRRKPKGKGSFLEKIVSKIAKQKDVSLGEGDVGSLLDNAVEELTNILDEVGPNLTESTENLTVRNNETQNPNEKVADITVAKENENQVPENVETAVLPVENEIVNHEPVVEVGPTLDENQLITISASENSVDLDVKVNEDFTTSKKRAFETNTPKKNKRKSVDAEVISEPEDLLAEELCLADIMKLIQNPKTNGQKESEITRPGKRKPSTENDQEILRDHIGDDGSNQRNNPENSPAEDGDLKRPKRRSTKKKPLIEENLLLSDIEQSSSIAEKDTGDLTEVCNNVENTPKKMNKRKTLPDEDPEASESETDQSIKSNSAGNRFVKRKSMPNDPKNPEDPASSTITKKPASGRTSKVLTQEKEALQEPERRSSKRKSSLANDITENFTDDNSVNSEIEKYNEESGSKAKNIKRLNNDGLNLEVNPETPETGNTLETSERKSVTKKRKSVTAASKTEEHSSKDDESKTEQVMKESKKLKTSVVPDDSSVMTKKRIPKKTASLVDEHLDLDSEDSVTSFEPEGSINPGIESKIGTPEVVERLRSLRKRNSKRKSLNEDHLELFEDEEDETSNVPFKVPEIVDLSYSRRRRSSKRFLTTPEAGIMDSSKDQMDAASATQKSTAASPSDESSNSKTQIIPDVPKVTTEKVDNSGKSLINEHLDLSDESNEDHVASDLTEQNIELNDELSINSTPEILAEDDQQQEIPKKRGSGNFAVGHTKTGEILIVEKKKKLTKEVARFFCEVCATSFTRKSSLKKHNSSQSHLMQLAKSEKTVQTNTPQPGDDDEKQERHQDFWGSEESLEPLDESVENVSQTDDFGLKSESKRVTQNPLTPQISEEEALEDELLDEEICKITENMTHDDFVLTDHISPELPAVPVTEKDKNDKKSQAVKSVQKTNTPPLKKRNLADEHLDLDSPSAQESQNTDEYLTLDSKGSSTPLKIDSPSRTIPSCNDVELLKPSMNLEVSIDKTKPFHSAGENTLVCSRSSADAFCLEGLQKITYIPLPKPSDSVSRIVSMPVTIQRDVLIPSDESSSDRPLSEVLMKSSISRSRNSRCFDTLEGKKSTLLTSTPEKHDLRESPMSLDFRNIAEKLNSSNERNLPNIAEFESDDSTMDTRISVDIRKILDDPELTGDKHTRKSDHFHSEKSLSSIDNKEEEFETKENRGKHNRKKAPRDNESGKYSAKKHARKSRSVKIKRRQCHLAESDSSEEENSDVDATSDSRNKNKIVKSVFGRVFGGEKLEKAEKIQDKVKEVLEDWDSRSEDDTRGRNTPLSSSAMLSSPGSKRTSRSRKRRNRSKTKTKDDEEHVSALVIESRSRRSKKRAEERISKAFEEDSTSLPKENNYFQDEYDQENEFPVVSDPPKTTESRGSLKIDDNAKIDDEEWAVFSGGITNSEKSNLKESTTAINYDNVVPETKSPVIRVPLPPWPSMSSPSPSSPGQSSVARSSVRNRSPTPDRNSQFSGASDSEDDGPRGRLSPVFVRNTPDTSMDSLNSSDETPGVFTIENNKKSPMVVSSPNSKHFDRDPEVVTIAPNDAVEDNALDVPRPLHTQTTNTPQKPRQAKVLNFDEELFVECCSRLKATTENELRGAKKIEIDHSDGYHKKDGVDSVGLRSIRDRWRDVESRNSLGSLLESVNQLLGEEMYAKNEKDYSKHTTRDLRSENSSRSGSPDLETSRLPDNLSYEDSLDVAFEHNNKLRDKIQQRMRASENLITSSFACEIPIPVRHSHGDHNSHGIYTVPNIPMEESRNTPISKDAITFEEQHQMDKNSSLDSAGFKHKMNSTLGGLLDKLALSNLLHNSAKHDHNGSTPMKVLAELACARAPTTTPNDLNRDIISTVQNKQKDSPPRKTRNPIKELFERKKELNDRNQTEKTRAVAVAVVALKELNVQRQRKTTKKSKKRIQEFPLVRKSPYGGMAERKKRRDVVFEKKDSDDIIRNEKVKDVYDFDDEESQAEVPMASVVSFRSKTIPGEPDLATLASKTIVETLENGKEADILGRRLKSMIDRKFKEAEKSAPKTKGALKAFQNDRSNVKEISDADSGVNKVKGPKDVGRETIVGPMDDFVQRKQQQQQHYKRNTDIIKRSKSKKRSKTSKKKSRAAAWYENDSSDEFRTAAKTEDIGVGISKSQRTCSKGKQNLFAELSSTSSESEIENDDEDLDLDLDYGTNRGPMKGEETKNTKNKFPDDGIIEEENEVDEEKPEEEKKMRKYSETKKSESEMSDHPLIIDERRESDEDSSARNNYEPSFEMDDLYREDSSDEADTEFPPDDGEEKKAERNIDGVLPKTKFLKDDDLIPLEEALDLLDQPEGLEEVNKNGKVFLNDQENEEEVRVSRNEEEFQDYSETPVQIPREENELVELPEKLSSNEKPAKVSDNLPLHVFLSRKVQESKKRKQQHLKKLQEEHERILLELQPTRRQRKCAIGKQGLLAEISSSEEESYNANKKFHDKERSSSPDKPRKQKRESREKRKERYIEKKHEQIIAKEQKAIEEEILRELGKAAAPQDVSDKSLDASFDQEDNNKTGDNTTPKKSKKPKTKKSFGGDNNADSSSKVTMGSESENNERTTSKTRETPSKQKKQSKSEQKSSKKSFNNKSKRHSECNGKESKDGKERRSSGLKRDSTDEELRTTKSWNKVEEGVGVAIGRRKRAAANQLYYWSSSSDEEEEIVEEALPSVEEEDDRQEQHGWIVGDSHKRMITMLAMEKQLKEKRRRSEDEFEPNKAKNKKHRNSTS